jgi:hypothetical protein
MTTCCGPTGVARQRGRGLLDVKPIPSPDEPGVIPVDRVRPRATGTRVPAPLSNAHPLTGR